MKKFIIILFFASFLSQIIFAQSDVNSIDISSVDQFFKISEELNVDKMPSEDEWQSLFESSGYNIRMTTPESKERVKRIIKFAFGSEYQHQRDSVLNISVIDNMDDWDKVSSNLMLTNFLEMKKNMEQLKNFRNTYNFNALKGQSKARLSTFLKNPIDSLIVFPSVNLLCQEPDGQSKPKGIVIDFNLFYKQEPTNENENFLAHEMFHTYRRHFENEEFINSCKLMQQIDKLENEGIANMIDKTLTSILKKLKTLGYPETLVNLYDSTYKNTPETLQTMDSITFSFIHEKISEEEFNTQFTDIFKFGVHPCSLYMTDIIQKAGLKDELLENFYNPVSFIKIYNKAAKKENTYAFSNEFVHYIEKLKLKYNPD